MNLCLSCGEPYEGRDCMCIFKGVTIWQEWSASSTTANSRFVT